MKKSVTKKEFNDYKKEDKKQDKAMMEKAVKKQPVKNSKSVEKRLSIAKTGEMPKAAAVKKRVKTDSSY